MVLDLVLVLDLDIRAQDLVVLVQEVVEQNADAVPNWIAPSS